MQTITAPNIAFAATALIAANLCQQILALQNSIAARDPEAQFPTPEETSVICKLINCLDKVTKIASRMDKAEQEVVSSAPPGPTTDEFNRGVTTSMPPTSRPEPMPAPPQPATTTVQKIPIPPPVHAVPEPVVSFADFQQNAELLARPRLLAAQRDPLSTILWKGTQRTIAWLQYNLFQWQLPEGDRKFFPDEHRYHEAFDHRKICNKILEHHTLYGIRHAAPQAGAVRA